MDILKFLTSGMVNGFGSKVGEEIDPETMKIYEAEFDKAMETMMSQGNVNEKDLKKAKKLMNNKKIKKELILMLKNMGMI